MPRVLIDATAVPADRGGLARYVDGLVPALARRDADLAIVCQRADEQHYAVLAPKATVVTGPAAIASRAARLAWEQAGLPRVVRQVNADVLHTPYYIAPLRPGRPLVVTVHDVTVFTEPAVFNSTKGAFVRSAIKAAVKAATRVITPSKATRDELLHVLHVDPTRVDIAYHGVDHTVFYPPSEAEKARVRARLGLADARYIAFLGALEPRRNVPGLIAAYGRACGALEVPPVLVIAGGSGSDDEIDAAIVALPSQLRVLRPGYLREADLAGYLGGAMVVAYPSHGEGFGLPVVEAMACGAAVLTTPRLSLPEVGGDAVAYAAGDPVHFADALSELLADADLRDALGRAAEERAAQFSWDASAAGHLESYERAAAERSSA